MHLSLRTRLWPLFAMSLSLVACELDAQAPQSGILGLVNATEIDIASKVPARISAVSAREGQLVCVDEVLVELQSDELEAKAKQAEAAITAAKAKLALAQVGARPETKRAARSAVDAAQHQVDITRKMYDRITKLYEAEVVPEARFDEVEFKYQTSVDQLTVARANYDTLLDGAREQELEALEALVQQAEAALAEVQAYRRETRLSAPNDAMVSKVYLHQGELAGSGAPIMTLVLLDDIWVSVAVREDLLQGLSIGDAVDTEVPALGLRTQMKLESIAVMGDFATWRGSSDRDRYDLRTFELRLRPIEAIPNLRPGMSVRCQLPAN